MITQSELKKLFHYDKKTGLFTRISAGIYQKYLIGNVSKCLCDGYVIIGINKKLYKAHRLAVLYVDGYLPEYPAFEIDHINHIRDDNRWDNIRVISKGENCKNIKLLTNNTSGFTGVRWNKKEKRWKVSVTHNSSFIHLGYFDDKQEAINARKEANKKFGFHANHGQ